MLHPSTQRLIDRLFSLTEERKIDWKEGEDGSCFYETDGYSVVLFQKPTSMVLKDSSGRELERAEGTDLAESESEDGTSYAVMLDRTFTEARRKALGIEKAIDAIFSSFEIGDENAVETLSDVQAEDLVETVEGSVSSLDDVSIEEDDVEDVEMTTEALNDVVDDEDEIVSEEADEPVTLETDTKAETEIASAELLNEIETETPPPPEPTPELTFSKPVVWTQSNKVLDAQEVTSANLPEYTALPPTPEPTPIVPPASVLEITAEEDIEESLSSDGGDGDDNSDYDDDTSDDDSDDDSSTRALGRGLGVVTVATLAAHALSAPEAEIDLSDDDLEFDLVGSPDPVSAYVEHKDSGEVVEETVTTAEKRVFKYNPWM